MHSYVTTAAVTICTSFCLCIGVANAAPNFTRKNNNKLKINVKKTDKTTGLVRKKGAAAAEEQKPQLTANDFIAVETKVKNIRNAQIKQLKLLIDATPPTASDLPDLLFRLAEIYAQKQRYWRFRAMDMYPKIDKASKSAKKGLVAKQKTYFDTEKKALLDSIKVYARLANEPRFKKYPRMDEVLFYFGYTLDGVKKIVESRKIYFKLIKDYPNSKYIPQAYLSFADYFFQTDKLAQAEEYYNNVLKFPKSPVFAYAKYKKGWVYLNQDKPKEAMRTFLEVVDLTKSKKKDRVINKAAKKDFVRAYAQVGKANKAYQSFQRLDKSYAFDMLKILGGIYLDEGAAAKAVYVYRELIGLRKKDPAVCEWQGNILSAVISAGNKKQISTEIGNLVDIYISHKKAKILKGGLLEECRDNAQGTTAEMAKTWHAEAIKIENFAELSNVEKLYSLYIKNFPKADDIGEIEYYNADLLWVRALEEKNPRLATDRWEKSAKAFTVIVRSGKVKGKMLKEAAYAAALAWLNAEKFDPRTLPKPELNTGNIKTKAPVAKPLSSREKEMIAAFGDYVKYVKTGADKKEQVLMKFLSARTYWRKDHLKRALPMFMEIIDNHPEDPHAEHSAKIIIDSLVNLGDGQIQKEYTVALLKKTAFLENLPDIAAVLNSNMRVIDVNIAEGYKEKELFEECGDAYLAIFNKDPEADGTAGVLFSAGVCYEQGKAIGKAIRMYSTLEKRYPDSLETQKALRLMGMAYGAIAHYDSAATKYETYAKKYGGEKYAAAALNNAVTYRKGLGDDKQAIADIELFVTNYFTKAKKKNRKTQDAAAALFGMAAIYEKQGDLDKVVQVYRRYIKTIGKVGGNDRLVIANAKIGEILWNQSCKGGGEDGACIRTKRERAVRRTGKGRRRGRNLPTQCGPESKIKLTVLDRDRRLVRDARKYFSTAIKLSKKGFKGSDAGRKAAAIYWMAASKFYMVGEKYEKFLALKFPTKLDFSPKSPKKLKDSNKRLIQWKTSRDKLGVEVSKAYFEVKEIKGGGAAWAVAAAARIGQTSQNYSDELYTAPIPKSVRTGPYAEDAVDAFCIRVGELAEPLESRSLEAFAFCLDLSTELNWFNDWSRTCEKELGQIRADLYPTATELHGLPNGAADIIDTQDLITSIVE